MVYVYDIMHCDASEILSVHLATLLAANLAKRLSVAQQIWCFKKHDYARMDFCWFHQTYASPHTLYSLLCTLYRYVYACVAP
jgi:hypothetical protein